MEGEWYCPQWTALGLASPPGTGQLSPDWHLTAALIFRDFTFPSLSREGTCQHGQAPWGHDTVRAPHTSEAPWLAQCCTGEVTTGLSSSQCALPAAVPALVFSKYLTTSQGQTLPLSVFLSGFEFCFLWTQAGPSYSNHSGPSFVTGLWNEPGDSRSSFIIVVPCAPLPQAGPYPEPLAVVRVDATFFAQHSPTTFCP